MYQWSLTISSALSQAKLGTLEEDLGLKGTEFNTITSILFIVRLPVIDSYYLLMSH